jgi:hypothetical protein
MPKTCDLPGCKNLPTPPWGGFCCSTHRSVAKKWDRALESFVKGLATQPRPAAQPKQRTLAERKVERAITRLVIGKSKRKKKKGGRKTIPPAAPPAPKSANVPGLRPSVTFAEEIVLSINGLPPVAVQDFGFHPARSPREVVAVDVTPRTLPPPRVPEVVLAGEPVGKLSIDRLELLRRSRERIKGGFIILNEPAAPPPELLPAELPALPRRPPAKPAPRALPPGAREWLDSLPDVEEDLEQLTPPVAEKGPADV